MNALRTTLTVALAAAVLIGTVAGGAAAAPGPDAAGDDAGPASDAGPPSDLPDQVPDFVGNILDSVNEFLDGDASDLGKTVSDIAGTDAGENETASGGSGA
jgi:hypothetical protein